MDVKLKNINSVSLHSLEDGRRLIKKNYLFIKNFLTNKEISELLDYFENCELSHNKTKPNYLYVTPEKSREISETIRNIIHHRFSQFFSSGNLLGGVFMVKDSGLEKEVDFHQDWSLVDENHFSSYNLWCPLTDATDNDGALMLLKNSHLAGLPFRSASLSPLEVKYHEKYKPYIIPFNFKAGDALLYNHNMFHGSNNNLSKNKRIAIACGIIPEAANFVYKHWNEKTNSVDSYKVDKEFYITHIHEVLAGKIPDKYVVVASQEYSSKPEISEEEFFNKLQKHNPSFLKKITSIFQ